MTPQKTVHALRSGSGKTLCGVKVTPALSVVRGYRDAQKHTTCKRCLAALDA